MEIQPITTQKNNNPVPWMNGTYLRLKKQFTNLYTPVEDFTERELEIIKLIAEGLKCQEIADKCFISLHTVHTHRKNIYRKGNFESLRDLIIFSLFI